MEALDTLVSRPGECPLCHRFDRTDFHMMCGPNDGQHVAICRDCRDEVNPHRR